MTDADRALLLQISKDLKDIKAYLGIGSAVRSPRERSELANNILLKFEAKRSKKIHVVNTSSRETRKV